jgi:hypothetical protein
VNGAAFFCRRCAALDEKRYLGGKRQYARQ